MEKDLLSGDIGKVGKYDVAFSGGKLVAKVDVAVSPIEGGMKIALDADQVIDALAEAIPGKIDDAVFALIKAALKS